MILHIFLISFSFFLLAQGQNFTVFSDSSVVNPAVANLTTGETIFVGSTYNSKPVSLRKLLTNGSLSSIVTYTPSGNVDMNPLVLGLPNGKFVIYYQQGLSTGYPTYYQVFNNDLTTYGSATAASTSPTTGDGQDVTAIPYSGALGFIWQNGNTLSLDVHVDSGTNYANNYTSDFVISDSQAQQSWNVLQVFSGGLLVTESEDIGKAIMIHTATLNPLTLGSSSNLTSEDSTGKQKNNIASSLTTTGNIFYVYSLFLMDVMTMSDTSQAYYKIIQPDETVVLDETPLANYSDLSGYNNVLCFTNGKCVVVILRPNTTTYDNIIYIIMVGENGTILSEPNPIIEISNTASISLASTTDGFIIACMSTASPSLFQAIPFDSNGNAIFTSTTCSSPKFISSDGRCLNLIPNCQTYASNGYCQNCTNSTVATVGGEACAQVIANCTVYNDDTTCQTCSNPNIATVNNTACAPPIDDCTTYSNNMTCQSCQLYYVLTVGLVECALNITNCSNYWDNKTCQSCTNNQIVTIGGLYCATAIGNCTSYWDNKTCMACNNSMAVTMGGIACAEPIEDCVSYYDTNQSCQACSGINILTSGERACALPITNCSTYSDDKLCETCNSGKLLTNNNSWCVNPIANCSNYTQNSTCNMCTNSTILSINNFSCANQITNCLEYSDDKSCLSCNNSMLLSVDSFACVQPLVNCIAYADNGICQSCLYGYQLSSDQLSCVEQNLTQDQQKQTVSSQISLEVSNTSLNGQAISIEKLHSMTISYANNSDYRLSLFNSIVTLQGSNSSIQTTPSYVNNSVLGSLTLEINLSNVSSDSFYFKMDIAFQKNSRRLLQGSNQSLPNSFIISYTSPKNYYIGTDQEIQALNPVASDSWNKVLFAILFSILMTLAIVIIVIACICYKKQKKGEYRAKDVNYENVQSQPPSDKEVKNDETKGLNTVTSPV